MLFIWCTWYKDNVPWSHWDHFDVYLYLNIVEYCANINSLHFNVYLISIAPTPYGNFNNFIPKIKYPLFSSVCPFGDDDKHKQSFPKFDD